VIGKDLAKATIPLASLPTVLIKTTGDVELRLQQASHSLDDGNAECIA